MAERRVAQVIALESVIMAEYNDARVDDIHIFTDSLAHFIGRLQRQRDEARERIKLLERECDGLKLALKRAST